MMTCNVDPWLGRANCTNVKPRSQGSLGFYVNLQLHLENFQAFVLNRMNPLTTSLSYDRNPLRVKRGADLIAEANAAKAQSDKRLHESTQPLVPYRTSQSPIIVGPVPGQRFLSQTAVPIKLATPKG